ncbi:DUF1203 domain-containing protein [Nitratireductor rhodophyticola]|uniref:DUF1203 domain-containing protein n=1 Tax=Nitratireductor rhodophyticola TaxID=2854036 RepID=A0ABS7R3V5_9HYPH|nr:DUF1203 domain-containing protein [Nitratireductor rhodophyticola]MBY8915612.1 DUF1203 domain-containing protein [Nitratireductor rhodophyticola]MBY8919319.1 DUF1203 domain-containing protein [Nitratireductor rhodophyticola]WPZ13193.1 DUF1203 domain-containing protein [Nitratireductor rhodophyticola]
MGLIKFVAMGSDEAKAFRNGAPDAYGMKPERRLSDGGGIPCRHCLRSVPEGKPYLILAYRPFPQTQPYAETGPVFLCAEECERAPDSDVMPALFRARTEWLLRGYGHDNRIVYGTGAVTPKQDICTRAHELLQREDIAYLHMRSAQYNCYQVRIDRA